MKRYVKAATTTSGFSFDFVWDNDYDAREIESIVYEVFGDIFNIEVLGVDFRSVDYSDIKELAGENVSQCGVDFSHDGNYPDSELVEVLADKLAAKGYEFIGSEFYSL